MSPLELLLVFSLGLVSSLHCLGMCGPIVLSYSVSLRGPRFAAHAAYNAGRILTYMFLGAIAGLAGRALGLLGELAGLASGARLVAGTAMIFAGVLLAKPSLGRRFRLPARWIAPLLTSPEPRSKFTLGLILGLLPCGLVYAALLKAVESGGALSGALTMLAFGSGTALALAAVGMASSFAGARFGRWSNRIAALSVVIFGAILLWRGLAGKPVCHG